MMIDPFIAALGIGKIEQELSDSAIATICDSAEAFLRAGGHITWDFWGTLGEVSRAAFVAANERIWKERASMIGLAAQSEISALSIANPEAARDEVARMAVDRAVNGIVSKLEKTV